MKHFFGPELRAFNAMTARIDHSIVEEFLPLCREPVDEALWETVTPNLERWQSDIRWISARVPESFALFEDAFHRLGVPELVADYVDVDREMRLFFGQIIIRSRCEGTYFHTDWSQVNNEAFTFLTPITDASGFGLLYHTAKAEVAEYEYRPGEAILFGDFFRHSTKPGRADEPVALLCFEFGTDRMEHWDKIYRSINRQARTIRQPDGTFIRSEF